MQITIYQRGDMNRDGILNSADIAWFALALTNPDAYFDSDARSQGGPGCLCIYGSESGNMDGLPGLDFDDVDDFAAAIGVANGQIVEAIERLSAPEPSSSALAALGIIVAAMPRANRRRGRVLAIQKTLAT